MSINKFILKQLIKYSNTWDVPRSNILDFTSIPFHLVRQCSKNSLTKFGNKQQFEKAWKDILTPTGTFKDIFRWSGNVRAQSLLRRMYLEHRYGSTDVFNNAVEKGFKDPLFFPTRDEVLNHFDMHDWTRNSMKNNGEDLIKNKLITSLKDEHDPAVANWDLESILEAAGCCVYGRNEFNQFCEEFEFYEFLTSTYLDELVNYIKERSHESLSSRGGSKNSMQKRKGKGNHYTVLEVGAGSGRMSYYLKEKLKHDKNIFIIATDPGSWQLTKHFRVEPYSYQDAIKAFQPNMILTSWMPLGEDWTNVMRRCNSVEEYLLIGEADGGCCGDAWKTWGVREDDNYSKKNKKRSNMPLYERDGFLKLYLHQLSNLQLQRYDSKHFNNNSQTVAFRRQQMMI